MLRQERRLHSQILLEPFPRVTVEVAGSRQDLELFGLDGTGEGFQGKVCGCQDVMLSDHHEQGGGRDVFDAVRWNVGPQALDAVELICVSRCMLLEKIQSASVERYDVLPANSDFVLPR